MGSCMSNNCGECSRVEADGDCCKHECADVQDACLLGETVERELTDHANGTCGCETEAGATLWTTFEAQQQFNYDSLFERRHHRNKYHELHEILIDVLVQASAGKGLDRHVVGDERWEDQRWRRIAQGVGPGFLLGQAIKKVEESQGFDDHAVVRKELLGAMHYIAMAIYLDEENKGDPDGS